MMVIFFIRLSNRISISDDIAKSLLLIYILYWRKVYAMIYIFDMKLDSSISIISNKEKLEIVEQCSEAVMIELGLSVVVALNL